MLKDLKTHHRKICQLSFEGYQTSEIAEKLDLTTTTISSVLRSPLAKSYINGLMDKVEETTLDVRQKLIQMNGSALAAIEYIIDKDSKAPYNVQLNAAKDVLDRNGYKPPDKHHIDMVYQTKSDDEIEAEIRALEQDIKRTYETDIHDEASESPEQSDANNSSGDPNKSSGPNPVGQ